VTVSEDREMEKGQSEDPAAGHCCGRFWESVGARSRVQNQACATLLLMDGCGLRMREVRASGDRWKPRLWQWKGSQYMGRCRHFATHAPRRDSPSQERRRIRDFCEVYVNGEKVGRFNARLPNVSWPVNFLEFHVLTAQHPRLWDTTHRTTASRWTPQCVHFHVCRRAEGYEFQVVNRKVPTDKLMNHVSRLSQLFHLKDRGA